MNFSDLTLVSDLVKNLDKLGYQSPTAIQAQAIPLILEGHDLFGIAQTGTGKTAAYCLPLIQKMLQDPSNRGTKALVLVPTRELATQIQASFDQYALTLKLSSVTIFGGVSQKSQVDALKAGVDLIVATPGRLLDLMQQGHVRFTKIQTLVMDEADRMLDMGFFDDIEAILNQLPKDRQSLLFSATMPASVSRLARRMLIAPKRVEVAKQATTADNIEQKVYFCKREDKFQLLRKVLKEEERGLVVVFTKTKNSSDKVKEYLRAHRIAATIFNGDKSQDDREKALEHFKSGGIKILIATDIASRGIDVEGVTHVINFEFPMEAETYVHRIGRTARAGKSGKAISFCEDSEKEMLEKIEKLICLKIAAEKFKGSPEASGKWLANGSIRQVKAPTPGKSQEKTAYLDHSKRRKVGEEKEVAKNHPGFRNKAKRKKR